MNNGFTTSEVIPATPADVYEARLPSEGHGEFTAWMATSPTVPSS